MVFSNFGSGLVVSRVVRNFLRASASVGLLAASFVSFAQVTFPVTFDEYPLATAASTTIIDSEYVTGGADNTASPLPPGRGFSVTTVGGGSPTGDMTLYNSTPGTGGNDSDLEFSDTGNVLISQEAGNTNGDGTGDGPPPNGYRPDDNPDPVVTVDFESPIIAFSFALIDIEPGTDYVFTASNGATATINAAEFIDPASPFFQGAACELGDNNFCIMTVPVTAASLGLTDFDEFAIEYTASGGIDGFQLTFATGDWTGTVTEDTDANGTGDSPLPNVFITLYEDLDGDGILSAAEVAAQPNAPVTQTDAAGNYAFNDVLVGDYIAVQTQPVGFVDVSEAEGGDDGDVGTNPINNNQIAGTVTNGENDSGNDFVEARGADGGICYGVAEGAQQFLLIDSATGAAHEIGVNALGVPNVEAIGWGPDPVTGERVLYAADADDFGFIDLTTGVYTSIGLFGSGILDVDGLHYDATTGTFWGTERISGAGNLDQIFQIDLATGQAIASTIVNISATTSPVTGLQEDIDDLAISPVTGTFYAVSNNGGSGGSLVTIDPDTGVATFVGDLGVNDIEGLSFDPAGNLFGSTGTAFSAPPNDGSELYSIDFGTGAASYLGDIQSAPQPPFRDVEALACLVEVPYFGSWSGTVTEDTTGDGNGDTPIGNVAIDLFEDTDGDGVLSAAEVAAGPVQSTTTDPADGSYEFTDVPPGDYIAVETQPPGLDSVSEDEGGVDDDGSASTPLNQISGTVVPNENDAENDFVEGRPEIELIKSISNVDTTTGGDPAIADAGDTVTYEFTVTNTGVVPLTNVVVSDTSLAGLTLTPASGLCAAGPVAPNATVTCTVTGSYVLLQADVDAGFVENSADVTADSENNDGSPGVGASDDSDTGTTPSGPGTVDPVPDPDGTENNDETNLPNDPADPTEDPTVLTLAMLGNVSGNVSEDTTGDGNGDTPLPGETLTLYEDTNGNGIADPAEIAAQPGAPTATTNGAGDYVFPNVPLGDYVVVETQPAGLDSISEQEGGADGDNGDNGILNQIAVEVSLADPDGTLPNEDQGNDFVEGRPDIELIKSISNVDTTTGGDPAIADAGDTVTYEFTVTNTGVVPLTNVVVSDTSLAGLTLTPASGLCTAGPIAPAATVTCTVTGSYVLLQTDVNAGFVENSADVVADSTNSDGSPGEGASDDSDTGTTPSGPGTVDPVPDPDGTENNDETNLPNDPADPTEDPTVLTLAMLGNVSGNVSEDTTGDGAGDTPLPGETLTLYEDTNGNGIADPAEIAAQPGAPTATTDTDGNYIFPNVPLGDYVVVETQPAGLDSVSEEEGGADGDNGDNNTLNQIAVEVSLADPDGTLTNEDQGNDFVEARPAIELIKSISNVDTTTGGDPAIADAGDTVTYEFTVTNTGAVPLTNITVTDTSLPGLTLSSAAPGNCAAGPLNVGDPALTCTVTATYTLLQADVDAGFVENSADVTADSENNDGSPGVGASDDSDTGTTPSGPGTVDPVPDPDGTENNDETNLPNDPADPTEDPTVLTLAMLGNVSGNVSEDTTGDGNGDTPIENVTLTLFTDPNGDGDSSDGVPVGAPVQTDVDGNYVFTNVPFGDYVVVETQPTGLDDIQEDEGGADDDNITANPVNEIGVTVGLSDPDANLPNEDINNDFVEGRPEIELIKSISNVADTNGSGITDAGDTVTYTFEVFNTGVTTLTDVTVSDALLGLNNAPCTAGPIAPAVAPTAPTGVACSTTGTYVLLQTDVDAGYVVNTATTEAQSQSPVDGTPGTPVEDTSDTGTEPSGPGTVDPVTDPSGEETTDPDPTVPNDPADPTDDPTTLTLEMLGNVTGNVSEDTTGDGNGDTPLPGETLTLYEDTNGNGIADPAEIAAQPGAPTATTDVDGNYVFPNVPFGDYVVVETQPAGLDSISEEEGGTDGDNGDNNTLNQIAVEVNAADPDGTLPNEDQGNDFVEGRPELELIKSISNVVDNNGNNITDAGDTVEYTFEVFNTGVTTLTDVTVSDALLGLVDAACTPGPIAPTVAPAIPAGVTCSTTGSYVLLQSDVVAGFVVNTATTEAQSESPVDGTPGTPVEDTSDTGTEPSGPGTVDPVTDPSGEETPDPDPTVPNDPADPADDPTTLTLQEAVSVGSTVFFDNNNNGVQDTGEPGVPGITVQLFPAGANPLVDAPIASDVTNVTGDYFLESQLEGDFFVYIPTPPSQAATSSTDIASSGADNNIDGDDNGIQAASGDPVQSPDITLALGGEPDNTVEGDQGSNSTGDNQDDANDTNGDMTVDFGFLPPASIGNYVWLDFDMDGVQDANEDGIAGVEVILTPPAGVDLGAGPGNPITTTTGPNGEYLFPDLPPANGYVVTVNPATLPAGLVQTYDEGATGTIGVLDNSTDPIDLSPNEEHLTADFGYGTPAGVGAIGDTIWIDADDDGVQDPGEPGIAGVTVTLTPAPGVDAGAGPGVPVTTVTDVNGKYLFPDLPLDQAYIVDVDITTLPTGYVNGPSNLGDPDVRDGNSSVADNSTTVVLTTNGPVNLDADFGYLPPADQDNTIGNVIWIDADQDGNGPTGAGDGSDTTELPLPGVTVSLVDTTTGAVIATTITDANGEYLFTGIPDGTYEVQVTDQNNVLAGLDPTVDADGIATPDVSIVDLDSASASATPVNNVDQDFGYVDPSSAGGDGTIGDTIFLDSNDSGAPDAGEGLEGVTVELFGPGPDGVIGGGDDVLLATTTTDENGNYLFTGLDTSDTGPNPGSEYQVVVDPTTLPNGGAGWDNTVDPDTPGLGDNESVTTLTSADPSDLDQDFGYTSDDDNTISGTVWPDTDGDGEQAEAGGFGGVTVVLLDENGNIIATTVTDGDGNYEFTGLPDGIYTVVVTDDDNVLNGFEHTDSPNGTSDTSNETSKDDTGYTVDLDSGGTSDTPVTDETGDFGYEPVVTNPISLGSFLASSSSDGKVTIEWATQTEVANLGFHLYAIVDGQWSQLNESLILSQGDSVTVQSYSATFAVDAEMFAISDIDLTGKETMHGPYSLGQAFGVVSERQVIDWSSEKAEREAKQSRREAQRLEQQKARMQSLQQKTGVQ